MKISKYEIKNFIDNIEKYNAVLLYGTDISKTTIITSKILSKLKKTYGNIATKEYDQDQFNIIENLISQETSSIDMFNPTTQNIILIKNASDKYQKNIIKSIKETKSFTIVTGNELSTKSAIKIFFDNAQNLASIGLYEDTEKESMLFIEKLLKNIGLSCCKKTQKFILSSVGNNRMIILSEIKKIATYIGEKKEFTHQDIQDLLTDYTNNNIYDLCKMILEHNVMSFPTIEKLINNGEKSATIIRYLQNYFSQILKIHYYMDTCETIDDAIQTIKPTIFFKTVQDIKDNIKKWSIKKTKEVLQILLMIEINSKNNSKTGDQMLMFFANKIINNDLNFEFLLKSI